MGAIMFNISSTRRYFGCTIFARLAIYIAILFLALSVSPVNAAPEKAQTILVMGDSLSAEYGLSRGTGWVALLQKRLEQSHPSITVVNASISGETTAGGKARIAGALRLHQPTVVIIALGGNDALRGLQLANTKANLESMADMSLASGAKVLLLGIQVPPNYGQTYTEQFAKIFIDISQAKHLTLVPFFLKGIADAPDAERYFQSDRIHPNAVAQPLIVDNVLPALSPLLD